MSAPSFNVQFYAGCLQLFPFHMPFPKAAASSADFRGSFRTYISTSTDTKLLFDNLVNTRLAFLQVTVPGTMTPPQGQITAAEQYLEQLYILHESLQAAVAANQIILCDREPVFEWSMYLSDRHDAKEFRSGSLLFEIAMMTQVKALLHVQVARELLNNDPITFCSEAGKQLLQAAALFEMLSQRLDESQPWCRKFNSKLPNPVETNPAVLSGLAKYLRGRAQCCAAVKAFNERKASSLLIARLFTGASNLHTSALTTIIQAVPAYTQVQNWLRLSLITTIGSDRELLSAVSLYQLAVACAEAGNNGKGDPQLGQALACVAMARSHIAEQRSTAYDWNVVGLPKAMSSISPIHTAAKQLADILNVQSSDWDRDNRLVYFQGIPSSVEEFALPLPVEALVANVPVATEPTGIVPVPFVDPPKSKGVFGAMMSVFRSPSQQQVTATAKDGEGLVVNIEDNKTDKDSGTAVGGEMTDEQFARELQRRLNMSSSSGTANT